MTELQGYNGKIAFVNLTDNTVEIKDLEEKIAREYLGGVGLSAKLMYDMLSDRDYEVLKDDPLDPVNPLIFATGPVTGTTRPSSGRYSVCGISPLTGIWGESTSGGHFCLALRNSGYDAIIFSGKSKKPVYVFVKESKFIFKDASKLWGKDTYKTQKLIKDELQSDKIKIACIGPAGENLVRYACVINDDGRAAGRTGMGAVMGSKNLKALVISSHKPVSVASPKDITKHRRNIDFILKDDLVAKITSKVFQLYGTNSYMDMGMFNGDVPAKYFTETEFPAELLTTKTIKEQYPVFITGCAGCTLKCAKQTEIIHEGETILVDGPEYESMAAYGSLLSIYDPKYAVLAHHYGNVYGFDTISSGVSIAFLIYLVENNLAFRQIKRRLKHSIIEEIHWDNPKLLLKLLKLIAERKGIGNLLADGVKIMAETFGVDPELAAHVKGLEVPMHDPRANAGQALSYMTACVGANHQKCDWFQVESQVIIFPEYDIIPGEKYDITGREKGVAVFQDIRGIDDSAISCQFETPPKISDISKYISLATGFRYSPNDIVTMGERMTNIKRVISCNLGLTREDDKLPRHVLKVFDTGPTAGVNLQLKENLKNYYKYRGWDWNTGRPTTQKLQELGILEGGETRAKTQRQDGLSPEELKELEQLKESYLPKVLDSTLQPDDIFNYLKFVCLFGRNDQDFQDEFGVVEDDFRLSILDVPEEKWYWMKLDRGNFKIGRGPGKPNPGLELIFKTEKAFMGVMNRTLNPVSAVISGKLKVKPISRVRIFQNFMGLYMDKFGLKF